MPDKYSLPDFLIIGAGKCGTTSLDKYLQQHPDIFMSGVKEPNFFAYESLPKNLLDKHVIKHYYDSVIKLNDYQKLFEQARKDQVIGEVSNTYLVMEHAAERIKHYLPHVKLIAILRQPAERIYSRYLHLARENELPTLDLRSIMNRSSIWWQRNDLIKEGFYYKNLSRYYNLFPAENIRVYFNEDLKNDPAKVIDDISAFLGISQYQSIDYSIKYNRSGIIKSKWYDMTIGHNSVIIETLRNFIPSNIYSMVRDNVKLYSIVNMLRDFNLAQPEFDIKLKKKITEEIYGEDIKNLQILLNKDLTHWLNFEPAQSLNVS